MQLLAQLEQLLRMATQSGSIKIYTYMHNELAGESLPYLNSPVCCSCIALTWRKSTTILSASLSHSCLWCGSCRACWKWFSLSPLCSQSFWRWHYKVYTVTEVYKYGTFSHWEMFDYTDLRFTVSGQSKQTSKQHTHAMGNAVLLVWGLLRLASK